MPTNRRGRSPIFLVAAWMIAGAALALADHPPPDEFARLLAEARSDPEKADFRRLRAAYAASPAYRPSSRAPFDPDPVDQEVGNGERVAGLLALDRALEGHWMDLDAQLYAAYACHKLGDEDRSVRHARFHEGLLRSILDAGDGRGYDTAWPVLSVPEEYHVLRLMSIRASKQALTEHEGHFYDVITASDPQTGQPIQLHFNIDAPHRWLTRELDAPKPKDGGGNP